MRIPLLVSWAAAFFVVTVPLLVSAARADDRELCGDMAALGDRAIAACTREIASGRWRGDDLAMLHYNRGLSHFAKDDFDRAIADYSEALRLNPEAAGFFLGRGIAHNAKGDPDRAIVDYSEAIRLNARKPSVALYLNHRGNAYRAKGDLDRAITDYDEAIRLLPKFAKNHYDRGVTHLYAGFLTKALADLDQARELDPKNAYFALWAEIVGQRSKVASRLSQAVANIDMKEWPAPVIRLFLGQMTTDAVLAAADNPGVMTKGARVCQAGFYSGEFALRGDAKAQAVRLFRVAVQNCPRSFNEWFASNAELVALGAAK